MTAANYDWALHEEIFNAYDLLFFEDDYAHLDHGVTREQAGAIVDLVDPELVRIPNSTGVRHGYRSRAARYVQQVIDPANRQNTSPVVDMVAVGRALEFEGHGCFKSLTVRERQVWARQMDIRHGRNPWSDVALEPEHLERVEIARSLRSGKTVREVLANFGHRGLGDRKSERRNRYEALTDRERKCMTAFYQRYLRRGHQFVGPYIAD